MQQLLYFTPWGTAKCQSAFIHVPPNTEKMELSITSSGDASKVISGKWRETCKQTWEKGIWNEMASQVTHWKSSCKFISLQSTWGNLRKTIMKSNSRGLATMKRAWLSACSTGMQVKSCLEDTVVGNNSWQQRSCIHREHENEQNSVLGIIASELRTFTCRKLIWPGLSITSCSETFSWPNT